MSAVRVKVRDTRSGIRNAHTRMPFRFGVVTLRAAPVMTLAVEVEDDRGRRATGYAGDFLAFRWFDKRPEKTLADNCADLIRTVETAAGLYRDAALEGFLTPFELWRATHPAIERAALADGFNRLGAGFGSSMLERGVIDAVGRLTGQSFDELVKRNALGIDLGATFAELRGRDLNEFLPAESLRRLHLRHTVGLVDPITAADRPPGEAVDDGLPETLEDYLAEDGVSYLKIKVAGDLDSDLARLTAIADLLGRFERRFFVTLDGNEQYKQLDGFLALVEGLKSRPALRALYDQVLFIEQPLERSVAMDPAVKPALAALTRDKPVIIDEADGWVTAFAEAIELGYRGTSHKNCKGVYKSLHNLALAGVRNERLGGRPELFLSAEDLTNLPVVPLQADLCVVATLGIDHVERNGHHYFRGLGHLTVTEKTDALAHHADLYTYRDHEVYLRILDGDIDIVSLQTPGMGFAALPDMDAMTPPEAWDFASLGQEEG